MTVPTPPPPLRVPRIPLPPRRWWEALGLRPRADEAGGYRVHAVETGRGPETVVLLHGLSGSSRWWQRNIPALADTRRVVVPDVIGFGRSRLSRPLPDVPGLADVLAAWMGQLDDAPVHLVGHSMGGHLAAHIAARHPDRIDRLVLVDPAGIPRPLTPRHVARFAYETAPPRSWGDPRFLPVIVGDALAAGPITILRSLRNILRDDVRPLLSQIRAPTLLIWGERDSIVPAAHAPAFRQAIPDARLLVLEGAYHNPMVDRPEAFNTAVRAFLDGEEVGE